MKKRYVLPFLSMCIAAQIPAEAQSPHWSWARRDGNVTYSINPDYPRQVVAATANRVLWGTVQNQRMLYNTMLGNYHVQEMDTSGNPTAALTIDGKLSLLQAKADAAGNWYILGTLYDSMKVGSGPQLVRSAGDADRFLMRLHAGTLAQDWFTMVGGDAFCNTETFIIDDNGIYLSIDSALTSRIVRYELSNGSRSTVITQNSRSAVMSISRDDFGGTYILGNCLSAPSFDFNGKSITVPTTIDYPWYIVHYGPTGTYDWHQFVNDITCTDRALSRIGAGGVYLSGDVFDTATIGTLQLQKATGEDNYLVAKLDNDGSITWGHQRPVTSVSQGRVHFGGQKKSLSTDSLLITTPESQGICVWGNGGITTTNPGMSGTVVAYNAGTGNAVWAKAIDADFSNIQQVATDGSSVYITGLATDQTSIGFDNVSIPATTLGFKHVPYLAKLNYSKASLSAEHTSLAYGLYVWPNPATTSINIYTSDRSAIRVLDVQGREMWKGVPDVKGTETIDAAGWPRGMYFVQQSAFGSGGVFKLVLR